jgi:protein TonB
MKKILLLILLMQPIMVVFGQKSGKVPNLIIFDKVGDVLNVKSFKVFQSLDKGYALARGISNDYGLYDGITVLLLQEGKYFYDEEIVKTPEEKVARVVGVYKYQSELGRRTVPVIQFLKAPLSSSSEAPVTIENNKVYDVVEHMPHYPNGQAALFQWLSDNIMYPNNATEKQFIERVIVSFVVECDGSISNATILKSAGKPFDDEALRVVKAMPKWTPGYQNGSAVRVKYTLPITFRPK